MTDQITPIDIQEEIAKEAKAEIIRLAQEHGRSVAVAYLGLKIDSWGRIEYEERAAIPQWFREDKRVKEAEESFKKKLLSRFKQRMTDKFMDEMVDNIIKRYDYYISSTVRSEVDEQFKSYFSSAIKEGVHKKAQQAALEAANKLKEVHGL